MAEVQIALQKAISRGDLFQAKKILYSKRLPLDFVDPENGYSLLFYAILYHQQIIVEFLLSEEPNLALSVVALLHSHLLSNRILIAELV